MKKVLLLINVDAGNRSARTKLYEIINHLVMNHCEVTVYPIIPKKGLTSEYPIRKRGRHFDVIFCYGGDGTLNHVINDLMRAKIEKPIAYLPGGTTNDFAKSLGLPTDVRTCCRAIAGDHILAYDIGRFNDRYFNYIAAFGAFTDISYSTNQDIKNTIGYAAYVLEGIASLPKNISSRFHIRIDHDGITEEGWYLFGAVSNATHVGGLTPSLMRGASMTDGTFEVMLISAPEKIEEIGDILTALAFGSVEHQCVRMFRTAEMKIHCFDEVSWTLDGEAGGSHKDIEIAVCPQAMKMMVP